MKQKQTVELQAVRRDIPADHIKIIDRTYGERHFVREHAGYKEVTKESVVPVHAAADRYYELTDAVSFIEYVKKHGDSKKGIIFFDDDGVKMFFDEISRAESVNLFFQKSLELSSFLGGTGSGAAFSQKGFVKLLESFPEVVKGSGNILPNIEHIKLQTVTDFESDIDPDNYKFLYQEKSGKQTGILPKKLRLTLPYFERSEHKVTIDADLIIKKPKSEDENITFELTDPRYPRTRRDALQAEVDKIKESLKGWLFVQGRSHQ